MKRNRRNTGGPAFPVTVSFAHDGEGFCGELYEKGEVATYSGMTLRDYFAAHAPVPPHTEYGVWSISDICLYRYRYADAMLAERDLDVAD